MRASVASPCYVFGVVAAGASVPAVDETGPAEGLRLIECKGLAAVVGTFAEDRELGRAADLLTHDRVVGAFVAAGTTVLPLRFGTLVADEDAVIDDVLAARHNELRDELDRLEGRVQYTLKVRYDQDVVLREVVAADPEIARLRAETSGDGTASLDRRMRLGELVVHALEQCRARDAQTVLDELGAVAAQRAHEPGAPDEVLGMALLVDRERASAFERRVDKLARRHHPRLRVRLVGPSPAYDFVGST